MKAALERFAPVLAGGLVFAGLHLVFTLTWERWFLPAELAQPWFLGSRRAAMATQAVFLVFSFAWGLSRPRRWRSRMASGGALAAGAVSAMALLFGVLGAERLLVGPTHLWPVALAAGAVMLCLPILAGTLASGLAQRVG